MHLNWPKYTNKLLRDSSQTHCIPFALYPEDALVSGFNNVLHSYFNKRSYVAVIPLSALVMEMYKC